MIYSYDDTFLTANIASQELEEIEAKAYDEVQNRLGVDDPFFKEKLVVSKVYMELSKRQLESEGMRAKYDIYKSDFDFYFARSKKQSKEVFNIQLARG